VQNCILWNGGNEIYHVDVDSTVNVQYSDLSHYWVGPGNIFTDPMFLDTDGVDGITGNTDDDLRLSSTSPCIDAGNNIGVPPEIISDLDGMVRYQDAPLIPDTGMGVPPIIDMGAYEFGDSVTPPPGPPVADAGEDQTVVAEPNGFATVTLDGSGSYDPSALPIYHIWQWYIGPDVYYALGETPSISLPVGTHLIELTVTNGIDWSAPDYVVITVEEPTSTYYPANIYYFYPNPIDRSASSPTYIVVTIQLLGISVSDVDQSVLPKIYPGGLSPLAQSSPSGTYGDVRITAVYSKSQFLSYIPSNGTVDISVIGRLTSSQEYKAEGTIQVVP
jgi:hypothetical protein